MEEVKDAVKKELEGPGRLLGYRAMHKKVRQEYNLHVTRDVLYNVVYDLDPEGLKARGGIGAKKKRKKGNFFIVFLPYFLVHSTIPKKSPRTFQLLLYCIFDFFHGNLWIIEVDFETSQTSV